MRREVKGPKYLLKYMINKATAKEKEAAGADRGRFDNHLRYRFFNKRVNG